MARRLMLSLGSLVLVLASALAAYGQIWSAAGVTAIVDEEDLSIHRFNSTGSVSIKPTVTSGTLDLRFPVHDLEDLFIPQQGDCPEIRANLRDTGAGARVIVRLRALSIFPGSGTQVTTLAQIDTNTSPAPGGPTDYRSFRTCIDNTPRAVNSSSIKRSSRITSRRS